MKTKINIFHDFYVNFLSIFLKTDLYSVLMTLSQKCIFYIFSENYSLGQIIFMLTFNNYFQLTIIFVIKQYPFSINCIDEVYLKSYLVLEIFCLFLFFLKINIVLVIYNLNFYHNSCESYIFVYLSTHQSIISQVIRLWNNLITFYLIIDLSLKF